MPGGDGTGPAGMGPMTGRAAGYCAGYGVPGFTNPVGGGGYWGFGRGRGGGGGGRGWRNRFFATGLTGWQRAGMGVPMAGWAPSYPAAYGAAPAPVPVASNEQQLDALKGQAEYLEDALDGIRKRIDELEGKVKQS